MKNKKRICSVLGICVMAASLIGCGRGEEKTNGIYENFLGNQTQLFFDKFNPYDAINGVNYFEEGRGYTLSEVTEVLAKHYYEYSDKTEIDSIEYAYIDCGMDGVEELAIRFHGMELYGPEDDSTLVYIIKDVEGRLELCYCYESWARRSASVNEYGYYVSAGSNSASNHSTEYGVIDKNGDWKYIAYVEEEANIFALVYPEELSRIPAVAEEKSYDGIIAFDTIRFKEYTDADSYAGVVPEGEVYSFTVYDDNYEDITEPSMYTDSVYKEIFDEAGVNVYSDEEIEAMMREHEQKAGLTDDIRGGSEIVWSTLE